MNLEPFFQQLIQTRLAPWASVLKQRSHEPFEGPHHSSLAKWGRLIQGMPVIPTQQPCLTGAVVKAPARRGVTPEEHARLKQDLKRLNPWRKGPFDLCGVEIESEWRSDMKWDRLTPHIAPLDGRLVLDVGCGNGYHCFRACGAGARLVVGIDHKLTFFAQNQALLKYLCLPQTAVLPLGIDAMPEDCAEFDTVFSMGVLYHVKDPVAHLLRIGALLRPGGQAVIETLVVGGSQGDVLDPPGRYACMPNVRHIPACDTLIHWLEQGGFTDVRLADVTRTTPAEQHVNKWGVWQSLRDFLDPADPLKTVEGHPAPVRAICVGVKP
jgi:tRNA (mo5U34)-methyltransferase